MASIVTPIEEVNILQKFVNTLLIVSYINETKTLEKVTGYALVEIKEQKEKFKQDSIPQGLTFLGYEITAHIFKAI